MIKETIGMIFLYILVFAACCPWPFQKTALVTLWVVSLFCATIPALMLSNRESAVTETIYKIRQLPDANKTKWRTYIGRISLFYIPYISILFMAGQPTVAFVWIFCYLALVSIARSVVKQAREEGLLE